jgi:hypothetical protein
MAFLDTISDIFTGGLSTALDIEAERERAEIENKRLAQDNTLNSRGDSERNFPTGTIPSITGLSGTDLTLILGGLTLTVALFGLLWRRA